MIPQEKWSVTGIWGAGNDPQIDFTRNSIFGIRITEISLDEPIDILGGLSMAIIGWRWNQIANTTLEMWTRLDGDTEWSQVQQAGVIPEIDGNMSYSGRKLQVKMLLSSLMSEIEPAAIPEMYELFVAFYGPQNKPLKYASIDLMKLHWKEGG